MKRFSAAFALLVVGCCLQAQTGSQPQSDNDLRDQIVANEREELNSLKAGDLKRFAQLLAEDAVFLDPHGAATKQEVVQNVADVKLTDFSIDDVRFVRVSERSGLIAYKLTQKGTAHAHEFSAVIFVSAIWAERGGKWVSLFSQETPSRASSGM
jgi:hypothetical protein